MSPLHANNYLQNVDQLKVWKKNGFRVPLLSSMIFVYFLFVYFILFFFQVWMSPLHANNNLQNVAVFNDDV